MLPEQSFFLRILADHLRGEGTEPPTAELDWDALFRLARAHQVDGIVYHQCRAFLPENAAGPFKGGYAMAVFYYENRLRASLEIADAFRKAGIRYYTIKGMDVARYYPVPPLRTMGDCDYVVDPADREKAIRTLRDLGFTGDEEEDVREWGFNKGRLHFELHDALLKETSYLLPEQAAFFRDLWPRVNDGALDWNYHYLYLLMHLRKHFMRNGVGIRQFLDLAVVTKNGPSLDWAWVEASLEQLKLRKFADACYALLEKWFDFAPPFKIHRLDETDCELITEKLLGNGVFGFEDEENRANLAKNAYLMSGKSRWTARVASFFRSLFPGYETMVKYPGCAFLEKKKFLLPVAWIRRFFYLIRRGDYKQAQETVSQSFISERALKEREELFSKMGLM